MRKITTTQVASATWAADTTIQTNLERVGLITRIEFTVEITPSATLTGANQPDGIFRLPQNLRIQGGSHTYFTLPADDGCAGGTLLHYQNVLDGFGPGHYNGAIAAPQATYQPVNFVLHCGTRPKGAFGRDNPFDMSGFIPAGLESQLVADWTTSGNDVMDDAVTITSAVGRFTLHRVLGSPQELVAEMARQGVVLPDGAHGMAPAWSAVNHANGATTTDFDAEQIDIVVGGFLKRISAIFQDATATRTLRASDEIERWAIKVPRTSETLYEARTYLAASKMGLSTVITANSGAAESGGTEKMGADFNGHAAYGIDFIDMRERRSTALGREYGWDVRAAAVGDLKLGLYILTRAAGDDTLVIFERFIPITVPLG